MRIFAKRTVVIVLLSSTVLIVAGLLLSFFRQGLVKDLYDQRAWSTWGDTGVSQISVFYPVSGQASYDNIRELEYNIQKGIEAASLEDGEDDTVSFVSCISAFGGVKITRDGRSQPVEAKAIGSLGDYFRFHPVKLLSGSYFGDSYLTPDRIMLDEDLAWQLFGSVDIAGQAVTIEGFPHTVTGVFRIDKKGTIESKAGIPDNLCLMSLESLCQLGSLDFAEPPAESSAGKSAIGTAKVYGIGVFEVVMPDPVKNFAINLIKEKTQYDKGKVVVVENSRRFSSEALWKNLPGLMTQRGMKSEPFVYPYWENIAIGYGNICSLIFLIQVIVSFLGAAGLLGVVMYLWRKKTWSFGGIVRSILIWKYDFEARWRHF